MTAGGCCATSTSSSRRRRGQGQAGARGGGLRGLRVTRRDAAPRGRLSDRPPYRAVHRAREVRLLPAAEVLDAARPVAFGGAGHDSRGRASARPPDRPRPDPAPRPCSGASPCAIVWRPQRWSAGGTKIDWQAVHGRFRAAGYRRPLLSFLLSLKAGGWCAVPLRTSDPLTVLQQRRVALQAGRRHPPISARGSAGGSPRSEPDRSVDGGQRKAIRNLKRLISERGAIREITRGLPRSADHPTFCRAPLGPFTP